VLIDEKPEKKNWKLPGNPVIEKTTPTAKKFTFGTDY
jgi:hypothetical protein